MTERDEGRDELEESRKAVAQARASSVEADAAIEEIHRTSVGIRVIVERNGYVDRFRKVLRGA